MTGERKLETAAAHGTVQRRDDGLGRRFDAQQHLVQKWRARLVIEFADIRTPNEMAADPGDDHRANRGVRLRRLDRREERGTHRLSKRVHGAHFSMRDCATRSRHSVFMAVGRAHGLSARSNPLDGHRDALSDADAHGTKRAAPAAALELAQRRRHEPCAARTQGVAERDGAALGIHVRRIVCDAELTQHGEGLRRKRLR